MDEISEWDFLGVNELTKKLNFMQLSQGLQAQSMGKIFFFLMAYCHPKKWMCGRETQNAETPFQGKIFYWFTLVGDSEGNQDF